MSYISACLSQDRNKVLVWTRENGKRKVHYYDAPYFFFTKDENGDYLDIYDNKLRRHDFTSPKSFYEEKRRLQDRGVMLYESDIPPHYKILSEKYISSDSSELNITFQDIEVDYDPAIGFSSVANPYAPISAISLFHYNIRKTVLLVVLPKGTTWSFSDIDEESKKTAEIIICENERELLLQYLIQIENADIVSGWNSSFFDDPYIYKRLQLIFGQSIASKLSFQDAPPPREREVFKFGKPELVVDFYGRQNIDYLLLFKKLEQKERHSFNLLDVSEDISPELSKIKIDTSLYDLYYNNFPMFVKYNIRDSVTLASFEDKLGYLAIAIDFFHSSGSLLNDVLGSVKILESAIINEYHANNKRVPDTKDYGENSEKFEGAFVLPPIVGMHENVASIDVEGLYPSAIKTNNISPETIVGQFLTKEQAYFNINDEYSDAPLLFEFENGKAIQKNTKEWRYFLLENNYCISGYGTVFDLNKIGTIPKLITEWGDERKEYKKEIKRIDALLKDNPDASLKQKRDYLHRKQTILKLKSNSTYGVLGNQFFKFYDIRMASSTTKSGREILMHMVKKVAQLLDGEYQYPSESTIYSDTDSCYFKTHTSNLEESLKIIKYVEKQVNLSFPSFTKKHFLCSESFSDKIKAAFDVFSDRCIFIKKKYYIMHLLYDEGVMKDKMKVMGLQIKKTSIPKNISKRITKFFEDFLKGKDWLEISREVVEYKNSLSKENILDIGIPGGVKNVEDYTNVFDSGIKSMIPSHVSASIHYNKSLVEFGDKEHLPITSGMKIKKFLFKEPIGRFKGIALPSEITTLPDWFIKNFSAKIDVEGQIKRLVDDPMQTILSAIGEQTPTAKILTMQETLEF